MAYAGGGGSRENLEQKAGYLNERQQDFRDQAPRDHLADQVHPTWWHRFRRRLKHQTPESRTDRLPWVAGPIDRSLYVSVRSMTPTGGIPVPRYLVQRNFGRVDDEHMKIRSTRSTELIDNRFTDITWEHSHVVTTPDGDVKTF